MQKHYSDAELEQIIEEITAEKPWKGFRDFVLRNLRRFILSIYSLPIIFHLLSTTIQNDFSNPLIFILIFPICLLFDIFITSKSPDLQLSDAEIVRLVVKGGKVNNKYFSSEKHVRNSFFSLGVAGCFCLVLGILKLGYFLDFKPDNLNIFIGILFLFCLSLMTLRFNYDYPQKHTYFVNGSGLLRSYRTHSLLVLQEITFKKYSFENFINNFAVAVIFTIGFIALTLALTFFEDSHPIDKLLVMYLLAFGVINFIKICHFFFKIHGLEHYLSQKFPLNKINKE